MRQDWVVAHMKARMRSESRKEREREKERKVVEWRAVSAW